MILLERDTFLKELDGALADAVAGVGSVVLVCGEAGIGKTSLVDAFVERVAGASARVLRGSCDALFAPRPLGPVIDMARAAGGRLTAAVTDASTVDRERLFGALLDELRRPGAPAVAIFENNPAGVFASHNQRVVF